MPAPDAITCDKLAKLIGTPRCPTLLDVRREEARASDARLVPGARADIVVWDLPHEHAIVQPWGAPKTLFVLKDGLRIGSHTAES